MITFLVTTPLPGALDSADLHATGRALASTLRLRTKREVGVQFVSLREMQALNRVYRKKDRPTDVLSFDAAIEPGEEAGVYLGDLVLCAPYAAEEAKRRSIDPREELVRLLAHGVLHLQGYDHATEEDESQMFGLQERVVQRVCG